MNKWRVYIAPVIIGWIAKQDGVKFNDYAHAVEGVRKIANVFSEHTIVSCGEGFLIYVENQKCRFRVCHLYG